MEPFLVAEVGEVGPVALALQRDTRLLGLRVELLDDAVHELREVERFSVELYEPGAKARHFEDLIGEPKQAHGALSDDAGEPFLLLRERAGSAQVKDVDGTTDRRERRPEFVGDGREEFPFRLLHLTQLARHRVERACERSNLVAAFNRDGRTERTGGDLRRGRGQQIEGVGHPPRDDGRSEQRQADSRAQRDHRRGPRACLEARGLGLRREDPLSGRRQQITQAVLDLLGERPRGGVRQAQRARPVAAPEQRLLLGDDAPVFLKRGACRAAVQGLPLAKRILGEALEVLGNLLRQLRPRHRVASIAQHKRARLEPREPRNRLSSGRGEAKRGDRAGRDLTVNGHETAHRSEAQGADARKHYDHERRGEEDLGTEPHAQSLPHLWPPRNPLPDLPKNPEVRRHHESTRRTTKTWNPRDVVVHGQIPEQT